MRTLVVGGTFDREGGKPSKIVGLLAQSLGWDVLNGGRLEDIESLDFKNYDTLLWMPNIDNSEQKIIPEIKAKNQTLLLISSKRVVEKDYTEFDVVTRLLKTKSNLGIMITQENGTYRFRLLDPLGNLFADTQRVPELADAINHRVSEIKSMSRIRSKKAGEPLPLTIEDAFLGHVLRLGDVFSRHVNAINPARFLGNASTRMAFGMETRTTRCCHGFPGQRVEGKILVSRRNVDKQNMSGKDFVAVEAGRTDEVIYYGDVKPSVDSPIQIRLFDFYPRVNYIIHGHAYVEGAPFTESKIPCGHVEEFGEIRSLYPDPTSTNFTVNLKGHGCLILAETPDYFSQVQVYSRPFPEPKI